MRLIKNISDQRAWDDGNAMRLWAAGSNAKGQLGIGSREDAHAFTLVRFHPSLDPSGLPPLSVALGANHSLLLVSNGAQQLLLGAGDSSKGQLGSITSVDRLVFEGLPLELLARRFTISPIDIVCVGTTWNVSYLAIQGTEKDRLIQLDEADFHLLETGVADGRFLVLVGGPRHLVAAVQSQDEVVLVGCGVTRHGQLGSHHTSTRVRRSFGRAAFCLSFSFACSCRCGSN